MITDDKRSVLISSMGWVHHAELWVFDVNRDRERRVSAPTQAKYLAPHSGGTARELSGVDLWNG